jgi:hypothetical protein
MSVHIFTSRQQWAIALTRHISGNLSLVASSIIVYHIVLRVLQNRRSPRRDLVTPYHRLMLGFSVADILYSFWVGLSTLVVPASSGVIYGFGTTATCSMQGFFMQFGTATHLYIAVLSVYFLLKIRYNLTDDTLHHKFEIWFHVIPWVVAIGTGSIGVALQIYNPMNIPELGCWVSHFPADCLDAGGLSCTRVYKTVAQGSLYEFMLAYCWLFACFIVVLVSNIMIYRSVRCQERRNEQYLGSMLQLQSQWSLSAAPISNQTIVVQKKPEGLPPVASDELPLADCQEEHAAVCEFRSTEREGGTTTNQSLVESSTTLESPDSSSVTGNRRRQSTTWRSAKTSRTASTQSILYVTSAAFTVVWIFPPFICYKLGLSNDSLFFSLLMIALVAPLQGVFNLMIFVRLEYLRLRASGEDFSRLKCIRSCLFAPDLRDPRFFKSRRQLTHRTTSTELGLVESSSLPREE